MSLFFKRLDSFYPSGPILIRASKIADRRGYFSETYKKDLFCSNGIEEDFVQENESFNLRGVIRGLHFQSKQAKLVSVSRGRILDVYVDIRPGSKTFGKWGAVCLRLGDGKMLYIPPGFAHGFYTYTRSVVMYKVSRQRDADAEGAVAWDDPDIGIHWPKDKYIISDRDLGNKKLSDTPLEDLG